MDATPYLSHGCLKRLLSADSGDNEWEMGHNLQILSLKKIQNAQGSSASDRYRLIVSDGESYTQAMLAVQLTHMVDDGQLNKNTVVKVERLTCNNVSNKRLLILLNMSVVAQLGEKIGDPASIEVPGQPAAGQTAGALAANSTTTTAANTPQPSMPVQRTQPKANQPTVFPIEGLSPYQNKWTIRARITRKSDVKTFSNQKGEGKLFNVNFLDDSGEIRATFWNHAVDAFYDKLEEGKVYYVSKGRVNLAKKKFSDLACEYELSLDERSEITECENQEDAPQVKFAFVNLSELENVQPNATCDVIGIAKDVSDVSEITTKSARQLKKREITLVDRSEFSVRLTLWGKQAEEYHEEQHAVLAFKSVRVGDFGGRSLSMMNSSMMVVNPDIPESHILRGWFDSLHSVPTFKAQTTGPAGGGSRGNQYDREKAVTLAEIKERQNDLSDQAQDFSCRGTIVHIKTDSLAYPGCPKCSKKVLETHEGWRCEKCELSHEHPEYRYVFSMSVADYTGQLWIQGFNEAGIVIFDMPAGDMIRMKENDESAFNAALAKSLCKTYNFNCRAKQDTYNDVTRYRYSIGDIRVPDYKVEAQELLKHLKSDWAK